MFGNDMTQDQINRLLSATVFDQNGDKVGGVGQIYLDDESGRPSWATVKTGLFGTKETFVPLADSNVSGDDIRVPYTKDFIKDAPGMEVDQHLSEQEEAELYRYYNLSAGGYDTADVDRDRAMTDRDAGVAGGAAGGVAGVDRDRADVDRDRADLDRDREGSVVRREEELHVGKERVDAGRVRLRKHVVTDQETVNVPLEREEVHVTREPVTDGDRGGRIGDDQEVSVNLSEERAVVDKDTVAKERIGLDKDVVREDHQVSETVAKEQVEVERDGVVDQGRDALDRDRDGRIG